MDLHQFPQLAAIPNPNTEPLLVEWATSIDRLVMKGRDDVVNQNINIFDQIFMTMFTEHETKFGRVLLTSLQQKTFDRYIGVWSRFLAFIHRATQLSYGGNNETKLRIRLAFRLTEDQYDFFHQCQKQAQWVLETQARITRNQTRQSHRPEEIIALNKHYQEQLEERQDLLDYEILRFSQSLLRHSLHGDLHESALLSFLAVLGIKSVSNPPLIPVFALSL